jgi:DNA mismatch repair protein MutL
MRVTDDGCGIFEADLPLALQRHATSKISRPEDLWGIGTFGFRGEALPSIASVSRFVISSREKESPVAHKLRIEGGKIHPLEEDNLPQGTRVEVRDLFFNTPARLKFLKAPGTESGRIQQVIIQIALAHPRAFFRLRADKHEVLAFSAVSGPLERLTQVLGGNFQEESLKIEGESEGLKVSGWVGRPHLNRSNRTGQYLFVNERPVEHRFFSFTLNQAFGSLIPAGRHATAVVFLEVPAAEVDVNVHPAKREVRFRDESRVLDLIRRSVSRSLTGAQLGVAVDVENALMPSAFGPGPLGAGGYSAGGSPSPLNLLEPVASYQASGGVSPHQAASPWVKPAQDSASNPDWPVPLAQLHRTYLVCQSREGLVIIDQHAGHERVLYERFLARMEMGQTKSQNLLLPQKLSLRAATADILRSWVEPLAKMGLELSDMGGDLFYVTAVPDFLKGSQVAPLIQELLEEDENPGPLRQAVPGSEAFMRAVAARMACRAAVKAGDPLNLDEMRHLVEELFQCRLPWACPHGRPPVVTMSLNELEKYFQRK